MGNQDRWNGGWVRNPDGSIAPRQGGKWKLLMRIFANPNLPQIDDYYEPFTFDYDHLQSAPEKKAAPPPPAQPDHRQAHGEDRVGPELGRNPGRRVQQAQQGQELRRCPEGHLRPVRKHLHDVPAAPVRALPEPGLRGIVPQRLDLQARGRRHRADRPGQVPRLAHVREGCPYKKIYYNWQSGKAEKCIFCYPRIEAGQPTVCSETCVGRIRYLGVLLYDADRIQEAASVERDRDLYQAQLDIFLDPNDPDVIKQARIDGIPDSWMEAARNSPVYKMAVEWKVALPLHPEYRTLPMVWYVPPLSPITAAANAGHVGVNGDIPDVSQLRIPVQYLANLLTAGDTGPVVRALERMLAMRTYQRDKHVEQRQNLAVLQQAGLSMAEVEEMYHVMAIANYEDRFVIPTAHREYAENAFDIRGGCGFSFGNGCSDGATEVSMFGGHQGHAPSRSRRPLLRGGPCWPSSRYPDGQVADIVQRRRARKGTTMFKKNPTSLRLTLRALGYLLSYPDAQLRSVMPQLVDALQAEQAP